VVATLAGSAPGAVAAVFTLNAAPAAAVRMCRRNLAATGVDGGRSGWADALIATSGCANAGTGPAGDADQAAVATALAGVVGTDPERTLAMSTGLIGTRLPVDRVERALTGLVPAGLDTDDRSLDAVADALRTTDSRAKAATVLLRLPGPDGAPRTVTVSGVAKGVGMIHPRMATMLGIVVTDAAVEPTHLGAMLRPVVARTWDQLTVDGDTSTNDTVVLWASGASGAAPVVPGTGPWQALAAGVEAVARSLARQQAADGEGATTLITVGVTGARDDVEAQAVARAVAGSSLLKAAVHGADPNWGRILAAAGNARLADAAVLVAAGLDGSDAARRAGDGVPLDLGALRIAIGDRLVFAGEPVGFDASATRAAMRSGEVIIRLDLGAGGGRGEAFGCDLTEAYVIENSEYST
jgi:glutamate N-acetyltransferase / amino-acid N-acetyltransferase